LAAKKLGIKEVPTIDLAHFTESQKRAYIIADNKLALNAGWDFDMLQIEIEELSEDGFDLDLLGFSADELDGLLDGAFGDDGEEGSEGSTSDSKGSLSEKFLVPPFSVLNARDGWWQDRKRGWLSMGIDSGNGRTENLLKFSKTVNEKAGSLTGTSIFDPVLCEIIYRWFSPEGGMVLDPFAGGSVRGIVAAKLNRQYVGHELRPEQVEANREQAEASCTANEPHPAWICGDSRGIDKTCHDIDADLVFSCPPYADLEVYSDDPQDLSTLEYSEFRDAYSDIIAKACKRLKPNRFACFVVGEVRDKKTGAYLNFVGDTIQAFVDAGLEYYNEIILVTAVGTLPIRAGRTFSAGRKIGKTHQNVLVFVKGSGAEASKACGTVEVNEECFADYEDEPEVEEIN
jgi:DNA modification methylase